METQPIKNRCSWCHGDALYEKYHDEVWGQPETDDSKLFEMLTLELFQSGLSWITVLRKQEAFKLSFDHWDIQKIAAYDEDKIQELLTNKAIIRNRKKIEATINNAGLCTSIQTQPGGLHAYFKPFAPKNRPVPKGGYTGESLPLMIDEAKVMSKTLKKNGFKFTGPMVCMSFMQAVGMINDHVKGCDLCIY